MTGLQRTLTPLRGGALMLNIVVGAGLLALPGLVVEIAGDHALWSWLICAIASLPLLAVFIIMGCRYPHAGGIAHFARLSFGDAGYIVCSLIFLGAVAFGLPAIALTGGYYIVEIFGGSPTIYAAGIVILATASHLFPSEVAGRFSTFIASTILLTLIILLLIGAYSIDWSGEATRTIALSEIDMSRAFMPFMMIFFAFTGWEVAAGLSEEFRDPSRDFPRAMILSFIAATMLYVGMAFVVQNSIIPMAPEAAFVSIAEQVLGQYGALATSVVAAVIIFANLFGAIWAVSRMIYSLGREGYLPLKLKVDAVGVPRTSVILTALVILSVLLGDTIKLLNIRDMLSIAGQNFLILYGLGGIALLRLSSNILERVIAGVAILLTAVIAVAEGPSLIYPVCLALSGWLIFRLKCHLNSISTTSQN